MASKPYDPTAAVFDARYARWVAAQESGDEAAVRTAAADLPTLNARLLAKLAAVDGAEVDPVSRAVQKRLIVLVSEIQAEEVKRRRERKQAQQRRHDRTVRVERRVKLPTSCARCGTKLKEVKTTGRPRLYCSPACRKAAYEDRRARREGAVKVKLVEKVVTDVRERRIEVPHSRSDCAKAVVADDEAILQAIVILTALVRDTSRRAYDPDQPGFERIRYHAEALHDALEERINSSALQQARGVVGGDD